MNKSEKSIRHTDIMIAKLKRGEWISAEPFGYTRDYANFIDRGNNPIFIHEGEAAVVRMVFDLYASGAYSQRALVDEVNKKSSFKITRGQIYNILANKFYCGIMEVNGVSYPHYYGNIVPQDIFNQVQRRLYNQTNFKSKKKKITLPYTGLFKCSICQGTITGDIKKKKYIYYSCIAWSRKHERKYIKQEDINTYISAKLKELRIFTEINKLLAQSEIIVKHIIFRNIFDTMEIDPVSKEITLIPSEIWISHKDIAYEKLERIIHIALDEPKFTEVTEVPIVFSDNSLSSRIINLCNKPTHINDLILKLSVDIIEIQQVLFDLQMIDKITEVSPSCFQSK